MSTKEEIFEYVTETPENTNPAVLRSMLNELSGGSIDIVGILYGTEPFDCSNSEITSLPGAYDFGYSSLRSISLPNLTTFEGSSGNGSNIFYYCDKLIRAYLPKQRATTITTGGWYNCPSSMFQNCTSLQYADSDSIGGLNTALGASVFSGCTSLTTCDFKIILNLAFNAFKNCSNLTTIIFRNNSVATLGNVNVFTGTPFEAGGSGGIIYVPSAQINSYQTASNWSTLYNQGSCTFKAIEGSYYETHHGDGTPIG